MEVVGRRSASHCYSSALSDQKGGSYRPRSQFLFDDFNPLLNSNKKQSLNYRGVPR